MFNSLESTDAIFEVLCSLPVANRKMVIMLDPFTSCVPPLVRFCGKSMNADETARSKV